MPKVIYVDASGHDTEVEARTGTSLMQTAVGNGIDGIVASAVLDGIRATMPGSQY